MEKVGWRFPNGFYKGWQHPYKIKGGKIGVQQMHKAVVIINSLLLKVERLGSEVNIKKNRGHCRLMLLLEGDKIVYHEIQMSAPLKFSEDEERGMQEVWSSH